MTPIEGIAIVAAGLAAGAINTIVGSGSLITFPTLLAFGYPPLVANVSNTVGLVPGSISGVVGYRRELEGQRDRAVRLGSVATLGGLSGALLLLAVPGAFGRIVPFLILFAVVLVAVQPRLSRFMADRRGTHGPEHPLLLSVGVFLNGVYGGYFGAAQGVILMALLGIFVADDLHRLNALKNFLTVLVNGVAALVFILVAPVDWQVALLLAFGAVAGGQLGAYVGRRLPAPVLRAAIIIIGTIVGVRLLIG